MSGSGEPNGRCADAHPTRGQSVITVPAEIAARITASINSELFFAGEALAAWCETADITSTDTESLEAQRARLSGILAIVDQVRGTQAGAALELRLRDDAQRAAFERVLDAEVDDIVRERAATGSPVQRATHIGALRGQLFPDSADTCAECGADGPLPGVEPIAGTTNRYCAACWKGREAWDEGARSIALFLLGTAVNQARACGSTDAAIDQAVQLALNTDYEFGVDDAMTISAGLTQR
jgi:hypothetical protein